MNREQVKELLPVLEAFVEGKTIEYRDINDNDPAWWEVEDGKIDRLDRLEYRIKPEPREFYLYPESMASGSWNGAGNMYVTLGGLEVVPANAIKVREVLDE